MTRTEFTTAAIESAATTGRWCKDVDELQDRTIKNLDLIPRGQEGKIAPLANDEAYGIRRAAS